VIVIWLLVALLAVASAIMLITLDNPVHSALCLVVTLLSVATMYAMLNAPFVAIIQVAVYAGAIMVLFLFVIMLLNLRREEGAVRASKPVTVAATALGVCFFIAIAATVATCPAGSAAFPAGSNAYTFGSPQQIGGRLFHDYLFPFEATSLLLTVGMVGAILLARRKF